MKACHFVLRAIIAGAAVVGGGVSAQTNDLSTGPTDQLEMQPGGNFKLTPLPYEAPPKMGTDVGAPGLKQLPSAKLGVGQDLGADQDWYAIFGPSGDITGFYSLPSGVVPPESILTGLKQGEMVRKVGASDILTRVVPSSDQVRTLLEEMMANARAAVCGLDNRPARFGTAVEISAGVGISGRIEFNAEWDTVELCAE